VVRVLLRFGRSQDDVARLKEAVDERTAAVIVEPIRGWRCGRARAVSSGFEATLRRDGSRPDLRGQSGVRSGHYFACEKHRVTGSSRPRKLAPVFPWERCSRREIAPRGVWKPGDLRRRTARLRPVETALDVIERASRERPPRLETPFDVPGRSRGVDQGAGFLLGLRCGDLRRQFATIFEAKISWNERRPERRPLLPP
jgi:hypothetical protein